jgi:hypothetical protein
MAAPTPKTIQSEVLGTINALVKKGHYADSADFSTRQVFREIDKLLRVDAFEGHIAKAALFQACGDREKMQYHFNAAYHLGNKDRVNSQFIVGLSNLGYISEAQELYAKVIDPKIGDYYSLTNIGWNIFAFANQNRYLQSIKSMTADIPANMHKYSNEVAGFLAGHGVSDELLADIADEAGFLFRKYSLFADTDPINVTIDEESDCVYIQLLVNVSHEEAARLYSEFSKRLAAKYDVIPEAVHFDIRSGL